MFNTIFNDLYNFNRALNRAFDQREEYSYYPEMNTYENNDEYIIAVKTPGIKKEDISISFKDNVLKISGEKKEYKKEKESIHLKERFNGKFERSISMPEKVEVEKAGAEFKNGLLIVKLPKSEETKPVEININ